MDGLEGGHYRDLWHGQSRWQARPVISGNRGIRFQCEIRLIILSKVRLVTRSGQGCGVSSYSARSLPPIARVAENSRAGLGVKVGAKGSSPMTYPFCTICAATKLVTCRTNAPGCTR